MTTRVGIGLVLAALTLTACDRGPDAEVEPVAEEADVTTVAHTHAVEGETCFICEASKRDPGRLWCREHGRYEDRCWLCHPELEDPDRLYCKEHGLYEDECFLCHPELRPDDAGADEPDQGEGDGHASHEHGGGEGLFCTEHGLPEAQCAICQPQLAADLRPGEELGIRFASAEGPEKAGIEVGRAAVGETDEAVFAFAEIQFNGNSLARITPFAPGVVSKVLVDVGSKVDAGDPLVAIHSTELAAAKAAYLAARVDLALTEQVLRRERELVEQGITSTETFQEADAAARRARLAEATARQRLRNLGLTEEELRRVETEEDASATLLVRAPFAGTVVGRDAVVGEAVEPGDPLLRLADLSTVWLELSIPAGSLDGVQPGARVEATFDALEAPVVAELDWVDAAIDRETRMLRARAVAPNPEGRLKSGLFGEARIETAEARPVLRVPRDSVQRIDGEPFVFVKRADDLFAARRVILAGSTGDAASIAAGLDPDDPVVTAGSFTVLSEMLKAKLGAGCAGH